jgi:hypothetical protein
LRGPLAKRGGFRVSAGAQGSNRVLCWAWRRLNTGPPPGVGPEPPPSRGPDTAASGAVRELSSSCITSTATQPGRERIGSQIWRSFAAAATSRTMDRSCRRQRLMPAFGRPSADDQAVGSSGQTCHLSEAEQVESETIYIVYVPYLPLAERMAVGATAASRSKQPRDQLHRWLLLGHWKQEPGPPFGESQGWHGCPRR